MQTPLQQSRRSTRDAQSGTNGNGYKKPEPPTLRPSDPLASARIFRQRLFRRDGLPTLHHDGREFTKFIGPAFAALEDSTLRPAVWDWLGSARKYVRNTEDPSSPNQVPFEPQPHHVNAVIDALRGVCFTDLKAPCWFKPMRGDPPAAEVIVASNGLVHLDPNGPARLLSPPTARFFSLNALDYPFDPAAPSPDEWLKFLNRIFQRGREEIEFLQEWFGYSLTHWTSLQKGCMVIGPTRSGKGTVARVQRRMVGIANSFGLTLGSIGQDFGLSEAPGKLLAVIGDARLNERRPDMSVIVERLLSWIGEDPLPINRKFRDPISSSLTARVLLLSNVPPKFSDPSGALIGRFIVLRLTESFLHREDYGLEDRLMAELPGILLWSITGWQRLRERGRFKQPKSADALIEEMNVLANPVLAFVRDQQWGCATGSSALRSPCDDVFHAWRRYAAQHDLIVGSPSSFGEALRAAIPGIDRKNMRLDGKQAHVYVGIELNLTAKELIAADRSKPK